MEEFINFKHVRNQEEAIFTIEILKAHQIPYECDAFTDTYFSIELGAASSKGVFIKLKPQDFAKARAVLHQEAQEAIADLPEDYYLYSFSATELLAIVKKPDEWNELDYELAKVLLAEQGIPIAAEDENKILKERELERIKPIAASWQMIAIAILLLPVLYGAVLGWELATAQRVTNNGEKVYIYTDNSRLIGKVLVAIPMILILFFIFFLAWENQKA